MRKIISLVFLVFLFLNCEDDYSMVRKAIDAVNETTPAATWDGQQLKSISLVKGVYVVEFYITGFGSLPQKYEIDKPDLIKCGTFIIANFMTAYDYSKQGEKSEGNEKMFMQVGQLIEMLANNEVGIRFKLESNDERLLSFEMSPDDVIKAARLRKDSFYEKYGN